MRIWFVEKVDERTWVSSVEPVWRDSLARWILPSYEGDVDAADSLSFGNPRGAAEIHEALTGRKLPRYPLCAWVDIEGGKVARYGFKCNVSKEEAKKLPCKTDWSGTES